MYTQLNEYSDKVSHLSYLNDDVFKSFINLADEDSVFLTKQLIYLITGLKVKEIQKVDRVMDRKVESGKASIIDFIALVDDHFINIEVQKIIDKTDLLPKIQMYQSHVLVSEGLKGIEDYHNIHEVISIIFYEGTYIPDSLLVSRYEYTCKLRESDPNNKMNTYLVELGKINKIYKEKQMKMNKFERICFAIKNSDNEQFYDILKVIEKEEQEGTIMNRKYGLFREDIAEYMTAVNAELNEFTTRRYYTKVGKEEGLEQGLEQGITLGERKIVTRQILKTYPNQDLSWLDKCTSEQLEYALDSLENNYSFEVFKQKILEYI